MLKTELVALVAENVGLTQREASECVASFVEQVTNALARGEKVSLIGFGSFAIKHSAKRSGRNPQTGETIVISARNTPAFKAGSALKLAVNGAAANV